MQNFVQQGHNILFEVAKRYEYEVEQANKQFSKEDDAIETALQKYDEQWSRTIKVKSALALVRDHEHKDDLKEAREIVKEQLRSIQREREALENRRPRCEDQHYRRHKATATLFENQPKFYDAIVYRIQSEMFAYTQDEQHSE